MDHQELISHIAQPTPSRIIFLVIDGLGGLPRPETGKSELETARIPNLDNLARRSLCGLTDPVAPGVTPGSGPGHLALFGYDPVKNLIGRGVMEAVGIGLELGPEDLAVRGNFCTVDGKGLIVDRRAGRIPTQESALLCKELAKIQVEGVGVEVHPVKDHRFALIFRGSGLSQELSETDLGSVGVAPPLVDALSPEASLSAAAANEFVGKAQKLLAHRPRANMITLRGFSKLPHLPSMQHLYKLNPLALASYPMYRGIARLLGMKCLDTGPAFQRQVEDLVRHYQEHDFFFIHFKGADAAGEDGNFEAKVRALEEVDRHLPPILELAPDVLVVTGDHSTPAVMAGHSWHPVPFLMLSRWVPPSETAEFSERACALGTLGRFPAVEAMPLALAHAGKLAKFGA